jgi:hypothetical protein
MALLSAQALASALCIFGGHAKTLRPDRDSWVKSQTRTLLNRVLLTDIDRDRNMKLGCVRLC